MPAISEREYIQLNFLGLVSGHQILQYKKLLADESPNEANYKTRNIDPLIDNHMYTAQEVEALMQHEPEDIENYLVDKVLKTAADKVVYNQCPECDSFARTPIAKVCPNCGVKLK